MVATGTVQLDRDISHTKENVRKGQLLFVSLHAYSNLTFKHTFNNHLCRIVSVKTLFKVLENPAQIGKAKKRNLLFHTTEYSIGVLASGK